MDGGIVTSALIGAAIGGGTSALTGGDPLKGALTGGITGGTLAFATSVTGTYGVDVTAVGVGTYA
jgi:hypothetical protein